MSGEELLAVWRSTAASRVAGFSLKLTEQVVHAMTTVPRAAGARL